MMALPLRRFRRAPLAENLWRKVFDGGTLFVLLLILYYIPGNYSYNSYVSINIGTEKFGAFGFGSSSATLRAHAFQPKKIKTAGKVFISGPLTPNHRSIGNSTSQMSGQKFLLPLQSVGMKIHQVVDMLRDSIILAEKLNRTLVLPPLLHVTTKKHSNDFEVNQTTITAWDSWRTIDVGLLSQKINIIGVHQFSDICGKQDLQVIMSCSKMSNVKTNHYRYQDVFHEIWGFEPLKLMDINGTVKMQDPAAVVTIPTTLGGPVQLDTAVEVFKSESKCATVVNPYSCFSYRAVEWMNFAKYISLHPRVRSIADGFHKRSLHGKSFAVFRMDEFEYCTKKFSTASPEDEIYKTCAALSLISPEDVALVIKGFLEKHELDYVYLTVPIGVAAAKVEKIAGFMDEKAKVFSDMKAFINQFKSQLANSTVDFSLAEIDLASRADVFVGSEHSEWARAAVADRRGKNPETKDFSSIALFSSGIEKPLELKKRLTRPQKEAFVEEAKEKALPTAIITENL